MARLKESMGGHTELKRLQEQRLARPNAHLRRGPDGRLSYLPAVRRRRPKNLTRRPARGTVSPATWGYGPGDRDRSAMSLAGVRCPALSATSCSPRSGSLDAQRR